MCGARRQDGLQGGALVSFFIGNGVRQRVACRACRIAQVFSPIDLALSGLSDEFSVFYRFLRIFGF